MFYFFFFFFFLIKTKTLNVSGFWSTYLYEKYLFVFVGFGGGGWVTVILKLLQLRPFNQIPIHMSCMESGWLGICEKGNFSFMVRLSMPLGNCCFLNSTTYFKISEQNILVPIFWFVVRNSDYNISLMNVIAWYTYTFINQKFKKVFVVNMLNGSLEKRII